MTEIVPGEIAAIFVIGAVEEEDVEVGMLPLRALASVVVT